MTEIRRMDEAHQRKAKKLIRALCCNYDGGNCILLDDGDPCVCVQSISYSLLCRWFRDAVLPADRKLHTEVMEGTNGLRRCRECGQPFASESKNALYCKPCAARRTKRKKREWAQKNRGRM